MNTTHKWNYFALIAITLLLGMVFGGHRLNHFVNHYLNPIAAVEVNSTPDRVIHELGQPKRIEQRGPDVVVYCYDKGEVILAHGKVIGSSWKVR